MADDPTGQPAEAAPVAETKVEPKAEVKTEVKAEAKQEPAKADKTTVLTEKAKDEKSAYPDDWRKRFSKGDEKELKRLERMTSPEDVYDSFRNIEKKMSKGKEPDPFPNEGTDEEKSSWRKNHNVPNEAGDYLKNIKLDDGLVIGENDKPLIDEFLSVMHANNRDPGSVRDALNAYYKMQDRASQERIQKDGQDKTVARDTLRDEMGNDFQRNLQAAYGVFADAPEEVRDNILAARLPDGTALGNHVPTLKFLAHLGLETNPWATVVPGGTAGTMGTIDTEIATIEKRMREDRNGYFSDNKAQARYQELVTAREKLSKRKVA